MITELTVGNITFDNTMPARHDFADNNIDRREAELIQAGRERILHIREKEELRLKVINLEAEVKRLRKIIEKQESMMRNMVISL